MNRAASQAEKLDYCRVQSLALGGTLEITVRMGKVSDIHLDRRDGSDVVLVKATREESIREGLEMSVKTLVTIFRKPVLKPQMLEAFGEALPWTQWLEKADRESFFKDFIQTALACHNTSHYQPLEKCLTEWKRTAEIVNNPDLMETLNGSRGDDRPISLNRPE